MNNLNQIVHPDGQMKLMDWVALVQDEQRKARPHRLIAATDLNYLASSRHIESPQSLFGSQIVYVRRQFIEECWIKLFSNELLIPQTGFPY